MSEAVAPEHAVSAERALADAWCAVLDVPDAAPGDNFFTRGGDSLGVLKLIARLRAAGFALRLQELYENPEFAAAAALVRPLAPAAAPAPSGVRRLPLLPVQIRTLEYDRIAPDHHNDDAVWAVPDGVTVAALTAAVTGLVARHPVLGSRFGLTPGEQYQEVGHPFDPATALEVVEADPADAALVEAVGTKAHAGLDLRAGRVLAVRILTRGGTPWALALVAHHLVVDAMSWSTVAADLARLIEAAAAGTGAVLPAGTSYAEWVDFRTAEAAGPARPDLLAYWRSRPWPAVTGLPRLTGTPDRTLGRLRRDRSRVDLGDPAAFRRAVRGAGADAVVVGALNHALRAVHGTTTTLIDVVVNGRDGHPGAPDVSRTIGYLAEFAPVITELGDAREPVDVIRVTAEQFHAVPAPRIAFGTLRDLVPDAGVRREFREFPAADIYVNYRGALLAGGDSAMPELDYPLGPFQSPDEQQGYPLRIMVDIDGGVMSSLWKYSETELAEADVAALVAAFDHALSEWVRHAGESAGTDGAI